jgi:hypothetical protein
MGLATVDKILAQEDLSELPSPGGGIPPASSTG